MTTAISRRIPHAGRIALGLAFFTFGLNGFVGFMPNPPHTGEAGAFLGALAATGYMFPLIKGTETIAGAMLLGNRFVPLALVLLAPVLVNIVAFHAALEPATLGLPLALVALELFVAWSYRHAFRAVLAPHAEPRAISTGGAALVPREPASSVAE
jgi:hypothetical protein